MGKHGHNPLRFASKYPDVSSGPVPVEPYISADYFEREREAAVRRHRLSLRRADGIPTAGNYFVKNPAVQGVSVRVLRGDEGQVRALHAAGRLSRPWHTGRRCRGCQRKRFRPWSSSRTAGHGRLCARAFRHSALRPQRPEKAAFRGGLTDARMA